MILFLAEDLQPKYHVGEGEPVKLKYVIHACNMAWSYQWYCNGQKLLFINHDYSGANTTTLTIHRVTGRMKYWCVAENENKGLTIESATAAVSARHNQPRENY